MKELPHWLHQKGVDYSGKFHLVLDLDNTLCEMVSAPVNLPGVEHVRLFVNDDPIVVAIRPFARMFLRLAERHCASLSLWTNGTSLWAETATRLVFGECRWSAVLDREHSDKNFEKYLARMFVRTDYPHDESNTVFIDDSPQTKTINSQNALKIAPFDTRRSDCCFDDAFLKIALEWKWVVPTIAPTVGETAINPFETSFLDPLPFGLKNHKQFCYFNSLVQCILRMPSMMGRIKTPLVKWFKVIQDHFSESQQDAGEAMQYLLDDILHTPSLGDYESPQKPVWVIFIQANGWSVAQAVEHYFKDELIEGKQRHYKFPDEHAQGLAIIVHRSVNHKNERADRSSVLPSMKIVLPDDRCFGLRAIISHKGSVEFGHYTSMFIRNNGEMWNADDHSMKTVNPKKYKEFLLSHSKTATIFFYDQTSHY